MSTRATYQFKDDMSDFTVYKHYDGYPEAAISFIENSKKVAWPLPRFEASDFAAAFIAGNKESGGDVYLTTNREAHGDTEYHYIITHYGKEKDVWVEIQENHEYGEDPNWKTTDKGRLGELVAKYSDNS